jgi:hypothetical protein
MQQNPCGKCCVGNEIYNEKGRKTGETKNAEINNIVKMELYSGPKRVSEKDLKTKYLRSKNREFTVHPALVLCPSCIPDKAGINKKIIFTSEIYWVG